MSILCASLFFLYSINFKQDFQTKITIKNLPGKIFEPYNGIFYTLENEKFRANQNNNNVSQLGRNYLQNQYAIVLNENIKSIQNFIEFLDNNNKYEKFYKNQNINLEKYFKKSNFGSTKQIEKNNLYEYLFIFPENFPGDIFFADYISFSKNKTELEFKSEIKETIELALSHHEKQLETKQKIEITKSSSIDEYLYNVSYNDTKKKSEQSKMLINSLNQKNFDHNSFLIKPSKPVPVSQYFSFLCSLLGLLSGFFLGIIIIFFKNFKKIIL